MNDLLGGQVDFMCDQTTNTTSQIKAGKIKAYGVTSKARVPSLPDLPIHSTRPACPGSKLASGTVSTPPRARPSRSSTGLTKSLQVALKDATVKQRFADLGTEPVAKSRATLAALRTHLKAEIDRWGAIIKQAGVYAD